MRRVLVVDDKEENIYYLRALFSGNGWEVQGASNGAEALTVARERVPDLVVSDLLMPVMDGYTLLRHWKSDENLRGVPFVVYTATYTESEDEELALRLGADAFILKPTEPALLMDMIRRVLDRAVVEARTEASVATDGIMELYSRTLVRKLEHRTRQLEELNRALERDAEERRRTDAELLRSAALLRIAGRVARLGGWSMTIPERRVTWSDQVREIHEVEDGFEPDLEQALQFYRQEDRDQIARMLEDCARAGTPFDFERQLVTAKGRVIWVRTIGEAVRDDAGRIVQLQGAFQDVTPQRSAEERARRLAQRLTTTLESITDAFMTVDRDWRFTFLNSEAERLVLRNRHDLIGKHLFDEFPEAAGTTFDREYGRAMRDNVTVNFTEYYPPLGCWFEVRAYPSSEGLAIYFHDVTEAYKQREALRESERRFRMQAELLDKAQDAIIVRDLEHRVLYWNKSAERLYGYTAAEMLGESVVQRFYPDPSVFLRAFEATVATGEWVGELEQPTRDGGSVTVEGHWTLVRDDDGTPTSILVINTDITERKVLERQFLRAQRMESIGTLAGGIAHDLNNVLAPIMMAVELLRPVLRDTNNRETLDMIASSAERGAAMVGQVLSFARGVDGRRVRLNAGSALADVMRMVRDTFPRNIRIVRELGEGVWDMEADPTQIHQILVNLCVNARDAMPSGGEIRIVVGNAVVAPELAAANPGVMPGRYVRTDISDTGTGIPAAVIDKIFDPFFTTKPLGKGTGLGLSTTMGIVKSHGGFVQVASAEGKGTTFSVYIPATREVGDEAVPDRTEQSGVGRGALVLVVDDEEAIRRLTSRVLRDAGYRVVVASDGQEAVDVYAREGSDVAVVLLDMMMPVMDGPETIAELQRLNPGVRIVASSGIASTGRGAAESSAAVGAILPKPYTRDQLLRAIEVAIAGA